jgi:CRISPR type III-A-associated protein Csm2
MADEQSPTPPVSELAAQLAQGLGNKPMAPAPGSVSKSDDAGVRENVQPRRDHPERSNTQPRRNNPLHDAPRKQGQGGKPEGNRPGGERREGRPGEGRPGGDRGPRPGGGRDFAFQDIDLDKLINDSLYLDNQAHAVVVRIRDMDSGTRSTLRRLYNSVRRATRTPENERQHEFVMLRARLAYTIARHGLRSLDQIERLLLQVTRKNEARGYERFRDLFEAIVAYNE